MKILLISGHGAGDPGAIANGYKEANLTIEVVQYLADILKSHLDITIYPIENNAYKDIINGRPQVNFSNYDYVLEIHFNAGRGTGSEIYVTAKEKTIVVEQKILQYVSKYYRNRGVKVQDFTVIKTIKNKGVSSALLELCFIDNSEDINTYNIHKKDICKQIAKAIIEGFQIESSTSHQPSQTIVQDIINGVWGNGIDRKRRLEEAGYNYEELQMKVNAFFKANTNSYSIDEIAKEVIHGKWGNNPERKHKLLAAGHDYNAIQKRVNELLK